MPQGKEIIDELTVDVVDFEEEENFLAVGLVRGVLVHRVKELGQRDLVVAVLVEDLEHPLDEEGLQQTRRNLKQQCRIFKDTQL